MIPQVVGGTLPRCLRLRESKATIATPASPHIVVTPAAVCKNVGMALQRSILPHVFVPVTLGRWCDAMLSSFLAK